MSITPEDILNFNDGFEEEEETPMKLISPEDILKFSEEFEMPTIPLLSTEEETQSTKESGVFVGQQEQLPSFLQDVKVSDTTGDYGIPLDFTSLVSAGMQEIPQVQAEVIPKVPETEEEYFRVRALEQATEQQQLPTEQVLHERIFGASDVDFMKWHSEFLEMTVGKNKQGLEQMNQMLEDNGIDIDNMYDRSRIGPAMSDMVREELTKTGSDLAGSFEAMNKIFGNHVLYIPDLGVLEPLAFTMIKAFNTEGGVASVSLMRLLTDQDLFDEVKLNANETGALFLDTLKESFEELKAKGGKKWTDRDTQEFTLNFTVEAVTNFMSKAIGGGLLGFAVVLGSAIMTSIYVQNKTNQGVMDAMTALGMATPEQLAVAKETGYRIEFINPDGSLKQDMIDEYTRNDAGGKPSYTGMGDIDDFESSAKYTGLYGSAFMNTLKGHTFNEPYFATPVYNISSFAGDALGASVANFAYLPIAASTGNFTNASLGNLFASVFKSITLDQILNVGAGTAQALLYRLEPYRNFVYAVGERSQAAGMALGIGSQLATGMIGGKVTAKAFSKVATKALYDGLLNLEESINPDNPANLLAHPILAHLHPAVKEMSDAIIALGLKTKQAEGLMEQPVLRRIIAEHLVGSKAITMETAPERLITITQYLSRYSMDIDKDSRAKIEEGVRNGAYSLDDVFDAVVAIRSVVFAPDFKLLPPDENSPDKTQPTLCLVLTLPDTGNPILKDLGIHGQTIAFSEELSTTPKISEFIRRVAPDIRQKGGFGRGAFELFNGKKQVKLSPEALSLWKTMISLGEALHIPRDKMSDFFTKMLNVKKNSEFVEIANKFESDIDNLITASAVLQQEAMGTPLRIDGIRPSSKMFPVTALSLLSAVETVVSNLSALSIKNIAGASATLKIFSDTIDLVLSRVLKLHKIESYGGFYSRNRETMEIAKTYNKPVQKSVYGLLEDIKRLQFMADTVLEGVRVGADEQLVSHNFVLVLKELAVITKDVKALTTQAFISGKSIYAEPNADLTKAFTQFIFDSIVDNDKFQQHTKVTPNSFVGELNMYLTGGKLTPLENTSAIINDILDIGYGGVLRHALNSASVRDVPVGRKFLGNYTVVGNQTRRVAGGKAKEPRKFRNVQALVDFFAQRFSFDSMLKSLDPEVRKTLASGYIEPIVSGIREVVEPIISDIKDVIETASVDFWKMTRNEVLDFFKKQVPEKVAEQINGTGFGILNLFAKYLYPEGSKELSEAKKVIEDIKTFAKENKHQTATPKQLRALAKALGIVILDGGYANSKASWSTLSIDIGKGQLRYALWHEIGHLLIESKQQKDAWDMKTPAPKEKPAVWNEWYEYPELIGYSFGGNRGLHKGYDTWRSERYARLFSSYMTDNARLKKYAPQLYARIEALIDESAPLIAGYKAIYDANSKHWEQILIGAIKSGETEQDFVGLLPFIHRSLIEKAIAEGKTIPDKVLLEYPDLRARVKDKGKGKAKAQAMPSGGGQVPPEIPTGQGVSNPPGPMGIVVDLDGFSKAMASGYASLRNFALAFNQEELGRLAKYALGGVHFDEAAVRFFNALDRLVNTNLTDAEKKEFVGEAVLGFIGNPNNASDILVSLIQTASRAMRNQANIHEMLTIFRDNKLPVYLKELLGLPDDYDLDDTSVDGTKKHKPLNNVALKFLTVLTMTDPHALAMFKEAVRESLLTHPGSNTHIFSKRYLQKYVSKKISAVETEMDLEVFKIMSKLLEDPIFREEDTWVRGWNNLYEAEKQALLDKYLVGIEPEKAKAMSDRIRNAFANEDDMDNPSRTMLIEFLSTFVDIRTASKFSTITALYPKFDYTRLAIDVAKRVNGAYYRIVSLMMDSDPTFLKKLNFTKGTVENMMGLWSYSKLNQIGSAIMAIRTSFLKPMSRVDFEQKAKETVRMKTDITVRAVDAIKEVYKIDISTKEGQDAFLDAMTLDMAKFVVSNLFSVHGAIDTDASVSKVTEASAPMWEHENAMGFMPQALALSKNFGYVYTLMHEMFNGSFDFTNRTTFSKAYDAFINVAMMFRGTPEQINDVIKESWGIFKEKFFNDLMNHKESAFDYFDKYISDKSPMFKALPPDAKANIIADIMDSLEPTTKVDTFDAYLNLGLKYYPTQGFAQTQLIRHFPYDIIRTMIDTTDLAFNKIAKVFSYVLDPNISDETYALRMETFKRVLPDIINVYDFTFGFTTSFFKTLLKEIAYHGNVVNERAVHNAIIKTYSFLHHSTYLNHFREHAAELDAVAGEHPIMSKITKTLIRAAESVPIKTLLVKQFLNPFVGMSDALVSMQKRYKLIAENNHASLQNILQQFWNAQSSLNTDEFINFLKLVIDKGDVDGPKELFKIFYWKGLMEGDMGAQTDLALEKLASVGKDKTTGDALIDATMSQARELYAFLVKFQEVGALDELLSRLFALGRVNSIITKVDPTEFDKLANLLYDEVIKPKQALLEASLGISAGDTVKLVECMARDLIGTMLQTAMVNPEFLSTMTKVMPSWGLAATNLRGMLTAITLFNISEGLVGVEDIIRNPQYLPTRYYAATMNGLKQFHSNPIFLGRQFYTFRHYANAYKDIAVDSVTDVVYKDIQEYIEFIKDHADELDSAQIEILRLTLESKVAAHIIESLRQAPTIVKFFGRMLHEVDTGERSINDSGEERVTGGIAGVRQLFTAHKGFEDEYGTFDGKKLDESFRDTLPPFHPEVMAKIATDIVDSLDSLISKVMDEDLVGKDIVETNAEFDSIIVEKLAPLQKWFDLLDYTFKLQPKKFMNSIIKGIYDSMIKRYNTMFSMHRSMFSYVDYEDLYIDKSKPYASVGGSFAPARTQVTAPVLGTSTATYRRRVVSDPTYKEMLFPISDPFSVVESALNSSLMVARSNSYVSNLASLTNVIRFVPSEDPKMEQIFLDKQLGDYEVVDLAWFATRGDIGKELFKLIVNNSEFKLELYDYVMKEVADFVENKMPAGMDDLQKLLLTDIAEDEALAIVMDSIKTKTSAFGGRMRVAISKAFLSELGNVLNVDLTKPAKELSLVKIDANLDEAAKSFMGVIDQLLSEFRFNFAGLVLTNSNTSWMMNIYGALLLPTITLGIPRTITYVSRAIKAMASLKKGGVLTEDAREYIRMHEVAEMVSMTSAKFSVESYVYSDAPRAGVSGGKEAYTIGKLLMLPMTLANRLAFNVGWKGLLNIPGIKGLAQAYGFDTSSGAQIQGKLRNAYGLVDEITKFANYLAAREGQYPSPEWARGAGKRMTSILKEQVEDPILRARLQHMLNNVTPNGNLPKMTPEEAMAWAEKFSFTYYDLPSFWRGARNIVNPFISFVYNSGRILANAMRYYPVQVVATFTLLNEINRYLEKKHGISIAFKYMIPGFSLYDAFTAGDVPQELDMTSWSAPLAKFLTLMMFREEFSPFKQRDQWVPQEFRTRLITSLTNSLYVAPPLWDNIIRTTVYNTFPTIYRAYQNSKYQSYLPRESYQAKKLVEQGFRGKPIDDFGTRISLGSALIYATTGINLRMRDARLLKQRVRDTRERLYGIEDAMRALKRVEDIETAGDVVGKRNKLYEDYKLTARRLIEYMKEAGMDIPSRYEKFDNYSPVKWIDEMMEVAIANVYKQVGLPVAAFLGIGEEFMEEMGEPQGLPYESIIRRQDKEEFNIREWFENL